MYRIKHPVNLSFKEYTLSVSKTVRTGAFNSEFDAFESVPQRKSLLYAFDAPCGFYARRIPDGTFKSVYFPVVVEEDPSIRVKLPEGAIGLSRGVAQSPEKIFAFSHLLKTLDELMGKPVVWANDGTPKTLPE